MSDSKVKMLVVIRSLQSGEDGLTSQVIEFDSVPEMDTAARRIHAEFDGRGPHYLKAKAITLM